jgi:hypothetical protein
MKKFYTFAKLTLLVLFISLCSIANSQDFNVQHLEDDVARTGGTNTSFTAVASLNNAVALANNNRKSQGGRSDGNTGTLEGDDLAGGRVLTATGTLTYYRESGSQNNNMKFNTSIWEYTGAASGANEMIVRGRYSVDLNGGTYTVDQTISGITDKDNCVPIITGIMNNSGTDDSDSGTAIAYLTSSTNMRVEKGGTNSPNVRVYITLVEFTGSNWTVLHGDSGSVSADSGTITLYDGSDGTGTATDVSDWTEAFIFSQHRGDTATGGTNDSHSDNWPKTEPGSDDQSVDWEFFSTHDSDGTNRHFIHVLNNSEIDVTRYDDTSVGGTVTIDITSSGLTDLNQTLIIGTTFHSGTGQGYGRGWRNYKLNSLTQAQHWTHKPGGGTATVETNIQVVNFVPPPEGPAGITSNLELWLKANDGVEEAAGDPAEDADAVLNWLDASASSNDATQTTGTNKPIYTTDVFNFNPTLDFDGTNHEMTASISANSTYTLFAVAEGTYGSATQHLLNLNNGGSGSVILEQTAATTLRGRYYDGTGASGIVSTTVANGTAFLVNYDHVAGGTSELFEDGISQGTASANADNLSGTLTAGIGTHPTDTAKRWNGGIAEIVLYNGTLTTTERDKIESYLAIKYGFTLGTNGTSQDYLASDATVIWDQSANVGYNYNVTGVGRDDDSGLEQKQSKTINTSDDITIGIKEIATTNEGNSTEFFTDLGFLVWGNDNGATTATTDITKDFSLGITGTTTSVSATPIVRKWKMVVTDSIPTVKLSIPESMVSATNPGGEEYIMIIADDASFTTNVTSATMEDVGSDLEVDWYFEGTKFVTFGSTAETSEMSRSVGFDRTQDTYLSAGDVNDLANTDYTISAWVMRNTNVGKFDVVSKRNYYNENRDIDPGPDNDGNYTHGYAFRINQDKKFRMVWRDPDDSTNNIMQTSATIPEDEWHHICATYDSTEGALGTTRLYIDGILEDTDDTLDPMDVASDAHFMIGAANYIDRQQKHDGCVDEVRVWSVALSQDQIRYIMNQEIEDNSSFANGKVLPKGTTKNDILPIPWNKLIAYYPMSKMVFGSMKDYSNSGNDASLINYDLVDEQTAPLPYVSTQDGDWDTSTTWVNGDVQYIPGVDTYLDVVETIDWNIVQIDHDVTMDNSDTALIPAANNDNRVLLGLTVSSGADLEIEGLTADGEGQGLTVSHYLKLDGTIDLSGESQFIQTTDSDLDVTSAGVLQRDQQGEPDIYTYNYWSSPVGVSNITTNNNSYDMTDILKDGTDPDNPGNITFITSSYDGTNGSPIGIADYWIWKFANQLDDDYSAWQHVRSTGSVSAGEGYTMKGTGTLASEQNYVYEGKPNNGDISLTITDGNDYLVGNPYASAIDADEFINDNSDITGTLYFWEHWGGGSHVLAEYQGGYATYNLSGGAPAAAPDPDVEQTGVGTKTPEQYIPVGQGFFVIGDANGTIEFENDQRIFVKEDTNSIFMGQESIDDIAPGRTANAAIEPDDRIKIRIGFNSVNSMVRQLLVTADPNATVNEDFGYDAILYDDQKDDLFWMIDDEKYVIQGIEQFDLETVLPLGIRVANDGLNTIKLDVVENNPSNDFDIYLFDKELDIYHKLNESEYEFNALTGLHLERFEIRFKTNLLSTNEFDHDDIDIHYSNAEESIVLVNPTLIDIQSIELYNIVGQSITKINNIDTKEISEFEVRNLSAGSYVLKINTLSGNFSKKVLVE